MAAKPTDCPRCGGQRELDGNGGIACYFCGTTITNR
jgi:tRNA(Ile2) C34 agmatinyltransferase TiaS